MELPEPSSAAALKFGLHSESFSLRPDFDTNPFLGENGMLADFEDLVLLNQAQLRIHGRPYWRAQFKQDPIKARFTLLLGPRGVGKTTAIMTASRS
jgi:hypothetical protein